VLKGHTATATVGAVKFSPTGQHLASVDFDGHFIIWDVRKRQVTGRLRLPARVPHEIQWDSKGRKVMCWAQGAGAFVIDTKTMKCNTVFSESVQLETNGVRYMATFSLKFSSNGRWLLRGGDQAILTCIPRTKEPCQRPPFFLEVIDIENRKTRRLDAREIIVKISSLKNGRFAAIDFRGALLTGNISRTSTKRVTRNGGDKMVSVITFGAMDSTSNGRLMAIGGKTGMIELWQRSPLKKVRTLRVDPQAATKTESIERVVTTIGLSADGEEVAAATAGGVVQLWTKGGVKRSLGMKLQAMIAKIGFSPGQHRMLAVLDDEGQLHVVRLNGGCRFVVKSVMSYDWSADGHRLAVGGLDDGKIRIFDVK